MSNADLRGPDAAADVAFDGVATERIDPNPSSSDQLDPIPLRFDVSGVAQGSATDPQDVVTLRAGNLCGTSFAIAPPTGCSPGARAPASRRRSAAATPGVVLVADHGEALPFSADHLGDLTGTRLNAPIVAVSA